MILRVPRVMVAGLGGDSGKTLVALGLAAELRRRGIDVAGAKKGPDFIDAAWLSAACGRPARTLDTWMMGPSALGNALLPVRDAGLLLVEGNRGIFDGMDAAGSHSSAELARRIGAPVLLVVRAAKVTRTVAALVAGCTGFEDGVHVAGVILNDVATARQEAVIREALVRSGAPPVVGCVRRQRGLPLPGRHLGLVPVAEHGSAGEAIEAARRAVAEGVDIEAVLRIAREAPAVDLPTAANTARFRRVRIGVARDEAFSFVYPENVEALEARNAEVAFFSPLRDRALPEVDALWFPGGFPEEHAERLAANASLREEIAAALRGGTPAWAECGGLIYLARELRAGGRTHRMCGFLDLVVETTPRPVGHGYVEAVVAADNPFLPAGRTLRGHEFHYSRIVGGGDAARTVLRLRRGRGIEGRDGIIRRNTWASWAHLHAVGCPAWADGLVAVAGRRAAAGVNG